VARNLIQSLVAVLGGNILYFFVVLPHVPPVARHVASRLDLGLLIDFWMCLVCWGLIVMFTRRAR
jgi:hypothetical protein